MKLGERIKSFREKKGMNQKELAEASGITPATISRIESGKVHQVKSESLKKLARALGIAMDDLVDFEVSGEDKRKEKIDELFEFIKRDPNFKYGTRLATEELTIEAKLFLIEMYEKVMGRELLRKDSEHAE